MDQGRLKLALHIPNYNPLLAICWNGRFSSPVETEFTLIFLNVFGAVQWVMFRSRLSHKIFAKPKPFAIIYKIYVPKSEDKKARHEFSNPWHFINSVVEQKLIIQAFVWRVLVSS